VVASSRLELFINCLWQEDELTPDKTLPSTKAMVWKAYQQL